MTQHPTAPDSCAHSLSAAVQRRYTHGSCTDTVHTWQLYRDGTHMAAVQRWYTHGSCTEMVHTWQLYRDGTHMAAVQRWYTQGRDATHVGTTTYGYCYTHTQLSPSSSTEMVHTCLTEMVHMLLYYRGCPPLSIGAMKQTEHTPGIFPLLFF